MHSVWAVARNTIAQALRMKVAAVIIVLLLIILPLMSMIMVGDGTLHGKLQTFISYGLSLTSMLLCVLTIGISTFTLSDDVKRKYIHLVITKPIFRFQLLLGKLLGVVILNAFLLGVFSLIIYGLVLTIPRFSNASESELSQVNREFFTARASLSVPLDDEKISSQAMKAYKELQDSGRLPERMTRQRALKELRNLEKLKASAVEVGAKKVWEFENVRLLDPEETFFVRFKYEFLGASPEEKIYGSWVVGDYRQELAGPGNWKSPVYEVNRSDPVKTFREFEVPGDAIASDGYLAIVFANPFINKQTVMPQEVQVLYRADSFTANFIRVVLMILVRLVFLSALGLSASTWLSFPVAILLCLVVYFTGCVNGFILESFDMLGKSASVIYFFTIRPLLWFLPRFDGEYNPTQFMIGGRLLSWYFLAKIFAVMVFIKAMVLCLFGIWIFSNREIAKVTT